MKKEHIFKKEQKKQKKVKQTYIELYNCSESLDKFPVSSQALQAVLRERKKTTLHLRTTLEYIFHRLMTMDSSPIFVCLCAV